MTRARGALAALFLPLALAAATYAFPLVQACAQKAAPARADLPPMGAFQDNRPYADRARTVSGQREAGMKAWEAMLRRPANSLLAEDFYGDGSNTWAGLTAAHGGLDKPADWRRANPHRKLLWSIPLTMPGVALREVADGRHDREFIAAAAAIAAAQPDAIIRIGWEMNGSWMAWSARPGEEADYIRAYRRVVALFKARSARFSFDWCVSYGMQNNDPLRAYPGDDVVDTIGMDVYDFVSTTSATLDPARRWRTAILDGQGRGLDWLAAFAASRYKKMSIGEWGVGLTDARNSPAYRAHKDDPTFMRLMRAWLARNARRIAFQIYFDAPPNRIDDGSFPNALKALQEGFAAPR